MLASFDNTNLILYKVDLPDDEAVLEAIYRRSVEYREDQKLSHVIRLSRVFGETGPLRDGINSLVEPPTGESSYLRPDRDLTEIVSARTPAATHSEMNVEGPTTARCSGCQAPTCILFGKARSTPL